MQINTSAQIVKLRQENGRLRRENELLYSANSIIMRWLPDGTIGYVNEFGLNLFGYQAGELIGRPVMILVPHIETSGRELATLAHDIARNPQNYTNFVNENLCKNGERVWINWTNKAITGENGQLLEILAVGNDISLLKRTEQQLYESKAKLEATLASMTDAVFISDTEGNIIDFNDAFATFYKFRSKEECARTLAEYPSLFEVYFPDGMPTPLDMWAIPRALRGEVVSNAEYRQRRKDTGETVVGSYSFAPIRNQKGTIIGSVVVGRDITELRLAEQKLKESETRARIILESLAEGVVLLNTEGNVVQANPAMTRILGHSLKDLANLETGPRYQIVRPDGTPMPAKEQPAFITLHSGKPVFNVVLGVQGKDGSLLWISVNAQPIENNQGLIDGAVASFFDITDRKNAEDSLKKSEERLRVLKENLEDIVVQRTEQVHALSKALTLAEQRERKRFSHILYENLQQKIFSALLLFRQHLVDLREAELIEEEKDIEQGIAILENAVRTAKALAIELSPPVLSTEGLDVALRWLQTHMQRNYGLKIELILNGMVGNIRNEKQLMLTQMIRELLNNVTRHAGVFEAFVEVTCENKQILINVSDEGRGFDTDLLMTKTVNESKLGLLSIRERLRLFGGDLKIQSKSGQGTRVTITLPFDSCGK